jgi:hypothetical protein
MGRMPARRPVRDEWVRAKQQGLQRFIVVGALRRGIPMALLVLAILEIMDGPGLSRERLLSPDFAERVLFCFSVFLAGGALSSFARWKSYEALYGDRDST